MQQTRRNGEARDAGRQNYFLRGKVENSANFKTWKDHQCGEVGINLFKRIDECLACAVERCPYFVCIHNFVQCIDVGRKVAWRLDQQIKFSIRQSDLHWYILW